jgi:GNAT superfamily N-acetyltransferase
MEDGNISFRVSILTDPDNPEFIELENAYRKDIGEEMLTAEQEEKLKTAVRNGRITFFTAEHGSHTVGICSVSRCYSTFSCSDTAVFEDFYVRPDYRKKGIARRLSEEARRWCRERGIASITVCSAPCDEEMYRALGFDVVLGRTMAHIE